MAPERTFLNQFNWNFQGSVHIELSLDITSFVSQFIRFEAWGCCSSGGRGNRSIQCWNEWLDQLLQNNLLIVPKIKVSDFQLVLRECDQLVFVDFWQEGLLCQDFRVSIQVSIKVVEKGKNTCGVVNVPPLDIWVVLYSSESRPIYDDIFCRFFNLIYYQSLII